MSEMDRLNMAACPCQPCQRFSLTWKAQSTTVTPGDQTVHHSFWRGGTPHKYLWRLPSREHLLPVREDSHLLVGWLHPRHEHPVAVHELHEGVADGVPGPADADGLHHPRVPQLTHAQLPVKQLGRVQDTGGLDCTSFWASSLYLWATMSSSIWA